MLQESLKNEIPLYLSMGENELFTLLVPAEEQEKLYSRDGIIARGKAIFRSVFEQTKGNVCAVYRQRPSTIDNSVDLVTLVATTLMATGQIIIIPVLPFATLLVKIGLAELCKESG